MTEGKHFNVVKWREHLQKRLDYHSRMEHHKLHCSVCFHNRLLLPIAIKFESEINDLNAQYEKEITELKKNRFEVTKNVIDMYNQEWLDKIRELKKCVDDDHYGRDDIKKKIKEMFEE